MDREQAVRRVREITGLPKQIPVLAEERSRLIRMLLATCTYRQLGEILGLSATRIYQLAHTKENDMENPDSWGQAEYLIEATMRKHYDDIAQGVIGYSLAWKIADTLRKAGILREEE